MTTPVDSDVTIVMPVHNAMPFLSEAVTSIQNQTLENWTLLAVNDGSADGSGEFLNSVKDPRVRVIHQENQGPAAAFNRGLAMCDGRFVARMDADDICHPERLAIQLEFLNSHRDVGLTGTQIRPLGTSREGRPSHLPTHHSEIYRALLNGRHALCNPTIMCRTEVLKEVGGYQPDGVLEDWSMFLNVGEIAALANVDQVLLSYRIHPGSTNSKHMAELRSRIAYASDKVRRRQSGEEPLQYDEFLNRRRSAPLWRRLIEAGSVGAWSSIELLNSKSSHLILPKGICDWRTPVSWRRKSPGVACREWCEGDSVLVGATGFFGSHELPTTTVYRRGNQSSKKIAPEIEG